MRKAIYIIILSSFSCVVLAQRADSAIGAVLPNYSVGFNGGAVSNFSNLSGPGYTSYWLQNFKTIAPANHYLRDDFSKYDTLGNDVNANAIFNVFASIPLKLKNNKWLDLEVRGNILFCSKQKERLRFRGTDTSQTRSNYEFEFKGSNAGIELAPLFYFKKLKILYPYIGLGVGIAYSYNNRLITKYNPSGKLYDRGEWFSVPLNENTVMETTRLKNTASYYFNIPFGLALKRLRKPTHLTPFIDFKYGIKLERYPAADYKIVQAIYCQVGLKINFYKK